MTRWRCPVCNRHFSYTGTMEPACTGPTDRDDHEMVPMAPAFGYHPAAAVTSPLRRSR